MFKKKKLILIIFLIISSILFFSSRETIARINVQDGLTQIHEMESGEVIEGTLTIANTSDETQIVEVYQRDYFFTIEGSMYEEPGTRERSNAEWISIEEEIEIPPQGRETINYTIKAPEEDNLTGTYWSGVMIEAGERQEIEPEAGEDEVGIGLNISQRYLVQMVTNIEDTGEVGLEIVERRLVQDEEGDNYLDFHLKNTGERWLRPESKIELYNEEGLLVEQIEGGGFRLYPETSTQHSIELADIEEGTYQAVVLFDGGEDKVWGAQYTLNLE